MLDVTNRTEENASCLYITIKKYKNHQATYVVHVIPPVVRNALVIEPVASTWAEHNSR